VGLGWGYWYFVEPISPGFPSIVFLSFYLIGFIFFTVYTTMCCRHNLKKQLIAITSALGLIALGSVITSGLFYPISNAIGLAYMLADKYRARKNLWRIPESRLILIAAIGGSIGIYAGMQLARHKTKHAKFFIGVPLILAIQVVVLVLLFPVLFR
jgi:uncharacterized membrane protein YsdA (DUF1294 family)